VIVEGAGGLMVPLTRARLLIDVFARWRAPVVLCARTALGTINHTLLSIEALERRDIPLLGVAFIGEAMADTERTIAELGRVRVLGRLPRLAPLTPRTLRSAMAAAFDAAAFDEARP
jgi:dethiobiotin synthetase